jgi:hypothetical protein
MRNFHTMLTILPAGSYLPTNPPSGWYLRLDLASSGLLHSLSLGQGGDIDTPHKQSLQPD